VVVEIHERQKRTEPTSCLTLCDSKRKRVLVPRIIDSPRPMLYDKGSSGIFLRPMAAAMLAERSCSNDRRHHWRSDRTLHTLIQRCS
jgi:hypothetical protein